MTNRTPLGFLLFVLTAGLADCNGDSLPPPTAPTTVQPPPTPPTPSFSGYHVADVELSGVVYEMTPMGRVLICVADCGRKIGRASCRERVYRSV